MPETTQPTRVRGMRKMESLALNYAPKGKKKAIAKLFSELRWNSFVVVGWEGVSCLVGYA